MDQNLRRAIETFHHAKLLSDKAAEKYPKIHSSAVAGIAQESVNAMDPATEDILETIKFSPSSSGDVKYGISLCLGSDYCPLPAYNIDPSEV